MSRVVLEAQLILAPIKVQATLKAVAEGIASFTTLFNCAPSPRIVGNTILSSLLKIDADRTDIQWLVDAELMPPEFITEWEEATRAHA